MGERFWIRLWSRECERSDFWVSVSMAEGITIMLLVGALVYCLARYAV